MDETDHKGDPPLEGLPIPQKPLQLSKEQILRIRSLVKFFLPPEADRDFVADTIILHAWMKDIPNVSRTYIRHKCINALRSLQRERKHNEQAFRAGCQPGTESAMLFESTKKTPFKSVWPPRTKPPSEDESEFIERKDLVQEAVGQLTPLERHLIWMRYYDDQTLEEIAGQTTLRRDQIQQALKVALYKMRVHMT